MSKKTERNSGRLLVVNSSGRERRFLRGVITQDLVQRGIAFDDAYTVARAVRDELSGREKVSSDEIRDLVQARLEKMLGTEAAAGLAAGVPAADRYVIYHGRRTPFSRGLLARSLFAAGLDFDRAYGLVAELEEQLRDEEVVEAQSGEIARRVGDLLERLESRSVAQRYRLLRRIHRLPRPLVIYIGGASGTGKSSLALELAPLLRIYRITATDTVRQIMRMVFSQSMLPALHSSSFDAVGAAAPTIEDGSLDPGASQLLSGFEEQSARVVVGVRAAVERAIAEHQSILIEGVHLYPPWVPFTDLEGAAYQVPLLLASNDAEAHRARFLSRARFGGRRAERYLEHFPAIRTIHDFLLEQADTHDVPFLDTPDGDPPVRSALRVVTSMLQDRVATLGSMAEGTSLPTLLLVLDGLADRPVRALGGRTPLEAAATPVLDRLAKEGQCGLADPVAPGVVADTAAGTLALLGQSPLAMERGPLEALGAGLDLSSGDVALRGNFATLDKSGWVLDRRAGRIRDGADELAKALDRLTLPGSLAEEVEVRVRRSTEHRLAVVLRGEGLSSRIRGSDPGDAARPAQPLIPEPNELDDERAIYTARVLALFEQQARKVLSRHPANARRKRDGLPVANAVLTRGPGRLHRLAPLEYDGLPLSVACISGDRTVLGLARWLGAKTLTQRGMTANLDTDIDAKLKAAGKALARNDLVVVHLKGADIAAHDQRPDLKAAFLERVDEALGRFLEARDEPLRLAVASDHATLSESGQHAADPLPVILWGGHLEADEVERYDERSAATGGLNQFPLQMLLGRLFDLT